VRRPLPRLPPAAASSSVSSTATGFIEHTSSPGCSKSVQRSVAGKLRPGDGAVAAADQLAVSFRLGEDRLHLRLAPELGVEMLAAHAAQ
jgi:hypothetical protein